MNNPYSVYSSVQAQTAPRGSLVVMLYEGAIRFTRSAVEALARQDLENAHLGLVKAQEIVSELRSTLDHSAGNVADRLDSIYEYLHRQLVDANIRKDPAPAEEVARVLADLLPAWVEASRRAQAVRALDRPMAVPSQVVAVL